MSEAPDVVVIIGMPGVGKTTVGEAVAARLGWGFVDTDDLVAASVREPVPSYIERAGIEAFRAVETDAVATFEPTGDVVLAVGGGTVLEPANRARIAAYGRVVWLRATASTLLEHVVGDDRVRPLLGDDLRAAIARLGEERGEFYAALATDVVDVDGRTAEDAAAEVLIALRTPA